MFFGWLFAFFFGIFVGFGIAICVWSLQARRKSNEVHETAHKAKLIGLKPRPEPPIPIGTLGESLLQKRVSSCESTKLPGKLDSCKKHKPRQHLPRGGLSENASGTPRALSFDRQVLCEDAIAWLEGLPAGLPSGSSVLTGIPDIHEIDAEGRMGVDGYKQWFQRIAELIMRKLPKGGRAIFMQTDVKVAQQWSRNSGGGWYWQWVDKAHLLMLAASSVPGARLLWHKIIFSGSISAGGRNGSTAGYTHYLCFTTDDVREALDWCSFPDVLRKGLATWKSGSGAQSVELACVYLKARGCSQVVDPFCGEGAVLAIANVLGMASLGVELNKKRAKLAASLDGRVLLDADRSERKRMDCASNRSFADAADSIQIQPKVVKSVDREIEAHEIESYDGSAALHLKLDEEGSILSYLPSFALDLEGTDTNADHVFNELEEILLEVNMQAGIPPKDTSGSNGRAQYYGVAPHLRANPRWCNAARRLEGAHVERILRIKDAVEAALGSLEATALSSSDAGFNSVLVNRYADGTSQVAWHADDEKCYGSSNSILIASVSLGEARYFDIRRKPRKGDKDASAQRRKRIYLQPGSLLVMAGTMQAHWQHAILPQEASGGPRINLTFRSIVGERRRGESQTCEK